MVFNHFDILSDPTPPPATGNSISTNYKSIKIFSFFYLYFKIKYKFCIFSFQSLTTKFPSLVGLSSTLPPLYLGPFPVATLLAADHPPTLSCLLLLQISPTGNPLHVNRNCWVNHLTLCYQLF